MTVLTRSFSSVLWKS